MNDVGIDQKHQPQTYANHSTPLLNIIHISPFSTLVGMTALSRNEMTFAPPEKRLKKRLCSLEPQKWPIRTPTSQKLHKNKFKIKSQN